MLLALVLAFIAVGTVTGMSVCYAIAILLCDRPPRAEPPPPRPAPLLRMRGLYVRFGAKPRTGHP